MLAKIVMKSYMPKELELGMMFMGADSVYALHKIPNDMEKYIALHGAPVEPYIIAEMQNPDDQPIVLATPDQLAWWDEGEFTDELRDMTIVDLNSVLSDWDGYIEIETEEDDIPTLYEGKVTISVCFEEDAEEDASSFLEDEDQFWNWE
jgi:hypothetical protein